MGTHPIFESDFDCLTDKMLVLVLGDTHIPERKSAIPSKFRDILVPGKIQHILCTGNITGRETLDFLRNLAGDVHVVRGQCDSTRAQWPEEKLLKMGQLTIGLMHGHQLLPWDNIEPIKSSQRALDCDIMITGNSHQLAVVDYDDKLILNPGSLTGARTTMDSTSTVPSFMLLDTSNTRNVLIYIYKLVNGEVIVEQKKKQF